MFRKKTLAALQRAQYVREQFGARTGAMIATHGIRDYIYSRDIIVSNYATQKKNSSRYVFLFRYSFREKA